MKKLIEYKFENTISLYIDNNTLYKIIKMPKSVDLVEILRKINVVYVHVNNEYVLNYVPHLISFIHNVRKISIHYSKTRRFVAHIYVEV